MESMMDMTLAMMAHGVLDADREILIAAIKQFHIGKESPSDLRRKQDNYIRSREMYNMLMEDSDL
jgi:hypothetical protein